VILNRFLADDFVFILGIWGLLMDLRFAGSGG